MNGLQAQGLKIFDEGERQIFGLSGKGSAKTRQTIMGMLKPSSRPHPIAQCGINALRAAAEELRTAEPQDASNMASPKTRRTAGSDTSRESVCDYCDKCGAYHVGNCDEPDDTAPYGVDEATGEPYEDEAAAAEAARDERNRIKQTGRS